ncbi:ABC transporter permease [Acidaminobacter sp. JC074]|uniref:ABC transporter permease n=1 Tax=Acidaminobacter sp. JC074 TaxID=2530199 RepID=UPI001F0ED4FE|nr:ABC transporter permease subunit [Acidaminobacter sp. JC074]
MDRRIRTIALLTPISLLYVVLIGGGLFMVLRESLGYIPNLGFNQVTFEYYRQAFLVKGFYSSILISLLCAGISSSLSMIIGTSLAYRLSRTKHQALKKVTNKLMRIGMIMPYLYMVFFVVMFFSQSGLLSRILHVFLSQSTNDFPNFIYGVGGVILVFTLKGIPFVMMLVVNVMSNISSEYDHVALTLGSHSHHLFRKIYLPLSRDTIVWAGMVLFAYDLGSFEVPYILSNMRSQTFSVKLYSFYLSPNISDIPVTMAMTVILFLVGLISVVIFALFFRNLIRRLG